MFLSIYYLLSLVPSACHSLTEIYTTTLTTGMALPPFPPLHERTMPRVMQPIRSRAREIKEVIVMDSSLCVRALYTPFHLLLTTIL